MKALNTVKNFKAVDSILYIYFFRHYILTKRIRAGVNIELNATCVILACQVDIPTFITEKVLSTAMKHLHMCILATRKADGKNCAECDFCIGRNNRVN